MAGLLFVRQSLRSWVNREDPMHAINRIFPHMAVGVRFFPFGSNLRFDDRMQSRSAGELTNIAEGGGLNALALLASKTPRF